MRMYIAQVVHNMLMLPTSRGNAENPKRDNMQAKACTEGGRRGNASCGDGLLDKRRPILTIAPNQLSYNQLYTGCVC